METAWAHRHKCTEVSTVQQSQRSSRTMKGPQVWKVWCWVKAFSFTMLTVANGQVDSPGTVAVARVVARETRTENHTLHLFSDTTTLSWQRDRQCISLVSANRGSPEIKMTLQNTAHRRSQSSGSSGKKKKKNYSFLLNRSQKKLSALIWESVI